MMKKENPAATFHWNAPYRRGWLGGIVKSAAKAEAARRNGRKGGRPRKSQADPAAAIAFQKTQAGVLDRSLPAKPKHFSNCGPTHDL